MKREESALWRRRALTGIVVAGALVALGLFAWSLVNPYRTQEEAVRSIIAAHPRCNFRVEPGLPAEIAKAVGVNTAERIVFVEVGLWDTPVDLERLEAPLRSLPFLREFAVHGARLADRDLEFIGSLAGLRDLHLVDTDISDRGLTRLAGLGNLENFTVARSMDITDDAVERIAEQFPNLKVLDLSGTRISDEGMKHISKLSSLEGLFLQKTDVSSEGMTHLVGLPRLRGLYMKETKLDDSCIRFVQRMAHLQTLDVYATGMTGPGVGRLRKALPKCRIYYTRSEEELRQEVPPP